MTSKKKVVAIAVTTVALSLGSIGFASADLVKVNGNAKSSIAHSIKSQTFVKMNHPGMKDSDHNLAAVLAALVVKGTLTQVQVDAINAALAAARPSEEAQEDAARAAHKALIASTLGITVAALDVRLAAGDSLAVIAGDKTPALIAALTLEATTKIDAAVVAGKITAAQATQLKLNLTAAITARVNAVGEVKGMHKSGKPGNNGHHKGGLLDGILGDGAPKNN